MAFNCIRQHSWKSRELINNTGAEVKKGQLLALHGGELIAGSGATAGDILCVADADTANNAKGGFAIVDTTMEFEVDLPTATETEITAGTAFEVQADCLTVDAGSGFFISTEDTQPQATKVIGKFVDLPSNA